MHTCLGWAFLPLKNHYLPGILLEWLQLELCKIPLSSKFRRKWRRENTSRHNFSVDQLGSIMMVQWHCLKLPQNTTCVCWGNSLGAPFLILLELGASVWNWELSRIYLWWTIPSSQLVGSVIIWFLWLTPSLHSASLILNAQDSSVGGFLSLSFHWVKSDHMKHGSPDSIFCSFSRSLWVTTSWGIAGWNPFSNSTSG